MTFVRANAPGWALFDLLLSSQMNTIDSQIPFALDGQAGGSYTPSGTLVLDSASLDTTEQLIQMVGSTKTSGITLVEMLSVVGNRNDGAGTAGHAILAVGGASQVGGGTAGSGVMTTGGAGLGGGGGAGVAAVGGLADGVVFNAGPGVFGIGGAADNGSIAAPGGTFLAGNTIDTGSLGAQGVSGQGAPDVLGNSNGVAGPGGDFFGGDQLDGTITFVGGPGVEGTGGDATIGTAGGGDGASGVGGTSFGGAGGDGVQGVGGDGVTGGAGGRFTGSALKGAGVIVDADGVEDAASITMEVAGTGRALLITQNAAVDAVTIFGGAGLTDVLTVSGSVSATAGARTIDAIANAPFSTSGAAVNARANNQGIALRLEADNGGDQGIHIYFADSLSVPDNLADGSLWWDGTDLKLRSGGSTYTIDKTL